MTALALDTEPLDPVTNTLGLVEMEAPPGGCRPDRSHHALLAMVKALVVDASQQRLVTTEFVPASVIVVSPDLAPFPLLGTFQALLVCVRPLQGEFGKDQGEFGKDVVEAEDESHLFTQCLRRRFGEAPFGSLQRSGVQAESLPPHSLDRVGWGDRVDWRVRVANSCVDVRRPDTPKPLDKEVRLLRLVLDDQHVH